MVVVVEPTPINSITYIHHPMITPTRAFFNKYLVMD
jgi:hypothetical protein